MFNYGGVIFTTLLVLVLSIRGIIFVPEDRKFYILVTSLAGLLLLLATILQVGLYSKTH